MLAALSHKLDWNPCMLLREMVAFLQKEFDDVEVTRFINGIKICEMNICTKYVTCGHIGAGLVAAVDLDKSDGSVAAGGPISSLPEKSPTITSGCKPKHLDR
ncbi:uncharacterized protein VDAG_05162 [Verticillium dahliae VdLs.17]|uniref:Uncharacterized protein n=1 Tax=Verticillium dahliae (strain VdLs.17 / ATCC MYA-4575 / FGSC 10137) TaxID=498257 RepID=G2X4T0_VERDV|nr:uncharacterized protein VDAG_05162 [Verticillium dahliae VdLs.17]EGY23724.1 hypothetical protein VDAG_05162 [Verticillium dahliae VdLs.17]